ncbi:PAS domain-containing sensor histidine kinase [Geothrix sp. PMB-07]|uniref:hybrid sensor histidine kinase/response regulator n=1 Tax=Geothrix sp. PMB-07 TaxID=3068640 RepID=UPI002741D1C1|nr:PAS domain-containing sensor histidine kinase [Geothrix sp. PMB-07]WLT30805.1 PAS domain S-box protein [Geothrix sp. PMB-07]
MSLSDKFQPPPAGPSLAAMVQSLPLAMAVLEGLEGRVLQLNPAFTELFGYAPEDLPTVAEWRRRAYPDPVYRSATLAEWRARIQGDPAVFAEPLSANVTCKDGSTRFVRIAIAPLADCLLVTLTDLTEQRRTEEALQTSEAMYRELLERQGDGFGMVDAEERFQVVNPVAEQIFGVAPGRLLGRSLLEFLEPEQQAQVRHETQLRAEGIPSTYELRIRREDGTPRTILVTATPRSKQGEGRQQIIGVFRDITDQKAIEARLRESEARYRDQFNLASEGIYTLSPEGQILEVNQSSARMHGCLPAEMRGLKLVELCAPQAADLTGKRLRRILAGEALTYEVEHQHKDGHTFPLEVSASLITEAGEPRILVFHRDITERKRVEEALRESEEQLRTIFEASEAGIILVSPEGRIDFANRKMAELFGTTLDGLIGSSYLSHLHPSELEQSDHRMRLLMEGGIPSVAVERKYLRADGTEFWGHLSGRRLQHHDGSLRALLGIVTDITQRRQAEEEQQNLQAQLHQAQKMESLGSLAGGVAHDMNNVLGAILGLASAHMDSLPAGSPAHRAFGTIIKAAERGGIMLKSLLSFARQNTAEKRQLDLNTILREEVRLLERTTLAKVRLVLQLAPDLHPIQGDAGALTHALMNLCVNAVDAMPDNGTLTFRTRNLGTDWVEAQVEDTGSGMPKEVLEKALDPFFTTKEVGKGTGLGLSIVYSTVKAHQGQMELWSEPGRGTCVTMRFPACGAAQAATEASGAHRLKPAARSLKVLLVDDDELIQTAMMGLLELLGHEPSVAPAGEEALSRIEAGLRPDVVILDMNMPGLGGAGTLPRLRALLPTVPVLLATGRADQAALDLVEAHPFVSLLAKPFGMKDLEASLAPFQPG